MKYADYNEKKRHGSPRFPVGYYHLHKDNPQYVMVPHWHREFEIIRVIKGEFNLHLNNEEFSLSAGDIILVGCGVIHMGEPVDAEYECVVFDLNVLGEGAKKHLLPIINSEVEIKPLLKSKEIKLVAEEIFSRVKERSSFYELEILSLLYKFISELYLKGYFLKVDKPSVSKQARTIMKLLDYIEKNYSEPITLSVLEEISGFNPKYLCRVFKEYTAKTPIEYITELRIENACRLIEENHSITSSAFDCGFNDLSYFCKVFKKRKGITPREFKGSLRQ